MKKPLYDELKELRYISINELDTTDVPDTVVLYFNNLSETNSKVSVETIHGVQLELEHQNTTIELEDNSALFCLAPSTYVPTVTIDFVPDYLDPNYPVSITFTGTISSTDTQVPGDILVEYNGVTKKASLVTNDTWTVSYDLKEVSVDSVQKVTAKANSVDVNNPSQDGEFSNSVEREFNIRFTEVDPPVEPEEPEECTPTVNGISCLCLDTNGTYKVTVNGEEFTGAFQDCVDFLDTKGLYTYPSENLCNSCFNTFSSFGFDVDSLINFTQEVYDISVALYVNDEFVKDIQLSSDYYGKYAWMEILSQVPGVSYRSQRGDGSYDYYPRVYFINPTDNKINVKLEFGEDFYNLVDGYSNDFYTDDKIILEEDSTSYSFCFEPTEELDCNYTTEIMKADTYPTSSSNTLIVVDGVEYTLADLEGEPSDDLPVLITGDSYGITFQSNTYECVEVLVTNTTYEYVQAPGSYFGYHFIAPNFSGTMLEIGSNYYKFKLAPKENVEPEYALPVVSVGLLTDAGWTPSNVLDTLSSYLFYVNVTKDKDWLDYEENWSATVEINGEAFVITNETVSFNVPLDLSHISPSFSDQYVDISSHISSSYDYIEDREFFNETYTVLSYSGLIPNNLLQVETIVTGQEVYRNSTAESPSTHNILENYSWPREGIFKFKMSSSLLGHGLSVKSGEDLYPITSEMSIPYSNLYYTTFSNPRIAETARLSIINSEGRHLITLNYNIVNNTTTLSEENLGNPSSWSSLRVGSTYNFKLTGFHPSITKVALVDWAGNNGEPLDSQSPFIRHQEYNVNNGTLTLPAKTLTAPYTSYVSYPITGYLWFSIHARIVESSDPELVGKSVLSKRVEQWVVS